MLKILRVLIYKNLLVRRRQWKSTVFFEILFPLFFVFLIWYTTRHLKESKNPEQFETYSSNDFENNELKRQIDYADIPGRISYSPNNSFTKRLIQNFKKCTKFNNEIIGYSSEKDLLLHQNSTEAIAIVFEDENLSDSLKNLNYKIRAHNLNMVELYGKPNYAPDKNYFDHYQTNFIPAIQTCVDKSFIQMKNENNEFIQEIYMQRMPIPQQTQQNENPEIIFRMYVLAPFLIGVFSVSLLAEVSRASKEKFLGVHVLMAMNGVSNSLSLLSWVISGVIFVFTFIGLPTIIMFCVKSGFVNSLFNHGNKIIIGTIFILYISQLLMFGIHISAYFTKAILVTFGVIIFNFGSLAFRYYNIVGKRLIPYLGIVFPNLLFTRAIEEIEYYETLTAGISLKNLFKAGNTDYQIEGSVGMVLILSIVGIIFHFLMATYIYAINPGKYGTKKNPLFFLDKFLFKTNISHKTEFVSRTENSDQKLFETVNKEVFKPGLQIRNLRKIYNVGFFNKSEVHALRGVSIDFYKGQITSLLGHNGAGKTTMMSILTGMTSPSEGSILVDSKDLKVYATEIRNNMGLCTQENMMFPNLSIYEQLLFFSMLKGEKKAKGLIEQNIGTLLEKLKLYDKRHALPHQLSGGQKRRLCLGMAIVSDPSILILDEPTSGLDPENRRVIWDILLKMKGSKTILISTHDMEEADILGDRIAILHGGKFRSYGTSFFLKKILGEGNVEVNLSIEPWCDTEKILYEFDSETRIVNKDGGKIVLSTKSSTHLPVLLDKIEFMKKELGITGMSVSLLTLEQVFLRVTQEKDALTKSSQSFEGSNRVSSERDYCQISRGLFYKKMTYTTKNFGTILGMLFFVLISTLWMINEVTISWIIKPKENKIALVNLDMYNYPETFYKSYDLIMGEKYKLIIESFSGKAFDIKDTNILDALQRYSNDNVDIYNARVVSAVEYNLKNITIFYSENLGYSIPISVNLLSNAVLKRLTSDDYSISLSIQNMDVPSNFVDYLPYQPMEQLLDLLTIAIFIFAFFPAVALFVIHPLRESLTRVKHLQRITGASYVTYWGTMFIFDLVMFFTAVILIITSLIIIDHIFVLRMYYATEIVISLFLFGLFAISSLPFIYIFSFMNKATSTVIRTLMYTTLFLVVSDFIAFPFAALIEDLDKVYIVILKIQKYIYYIFPQISFLRGLISLFTTLKLNARCRSLPNEFYNSSCLIFHSVDLCCSFECWDHKCEKFKPFFYFTDDARWSKNSMAIAERYYYLGESLIFLSISPIFYFAIIAVLEFKLFEKLLVLKKKACRFDHFTDEQVNLEKIAVAEKISELKGNNLITVTNGIVSSGRTVNNRNSQESLLSSNPNLKHVFLVYELQKKYGNLQAVKDVSFKINEQECFGLLGVNGAGKSTTFRMMTGDEVLDHGIMYMGDKDYKNHKNYFLSQMGYCPQNDALITSLNSYDHLRLFARLRGIPENKIEQEMQLWIQRLNLKTCASQPCSTYSGGNKRRLNIAIALIGIPNLVLMDEPTTGVDPGARRSLWTVIQSCQATGQAVILTSHSMEECEALCNKLAIMVDGRFVCIGASQELKQRFGTDYNIQIKMDAEKSKTQINGIKQNMETLLDCEVTDENMGYIMYQVKPNQTSWKKMYDVMNSMKNKYDCIDDFSVSSSTLEQLFLHFAKSAQNKTA